MSSLLHSLVFFLAIFASATSLFSRAETPTIYDFFASHGFPDEILPKGLESYEYSDHDGRFTLKLKEFCYIQFFEYGRWLKYEPTVEGRVKQGEIDVFSGVSIFLPEKTEVYHITSEFDFKYGQVIAFWGQYHDDISEPPLLSGPVAHIKSRSPECLPDAPFARSLALQSS